MGLLGLSSYINGPNFSPIFLLVVEKIEKIDILCGKIVIFDIIF